MKKRYRFLLLVVLLAICFILVVWFQAHRLLPSAKIQEMLVQKVQTISGGTLRYQGVQIRYFPQPKLVLENPQLVLSSASCEIKAKNISFDFSILPLLRGHAQPSAIYISEGHASVSLPFPNFAGPFQLENFSLEVGTILPKIAIPVRFVSDLAQQSRALVVKGYVMVDSLENWNWEKTSGHMTAELKGLPLRTTLNKTGNNTGGSFLVKDGQWEILMDITKKENEMFLDLKGTGSGKNLTYEVLQEKTWVAPPPLNAEWTIAAAWNQNTEELRLHQLLVKLPFGNFEANGDIKLSTGEITGMHLTASDMVLESLLMHAPHLEEAIPFHIGFSGPSQWMMSVTGTLDHLSLHWNWAFTPTLLTYGQYFVKPKDIPFDVNLDFLIQKGETLSGDFSVKFQQMTVKGNLTDVDFKTGQGQLNLITNKFSIKGWEQYIPVFQQYALDGDIKILGNWKGNLRNLEQAEHIFNATIEKGSWNTSDGKGVRDVTLAFDYSPLMFEGRKMQLNLGDSPMLVDLKITRAADQSPIEVKIESKALRPLNAWSSIMALLQPKGENANPNVYNHVKQAVEDLFPGDQILENFSAEAHYLNPKLDISSLKFRSYEGTADLKGIISFEEDKSTYHCEGEIRDLNLGLFLNRHPGSPKVMEGTLRLQGEVDGMGWGREAWRKNLKGHGEWMLTQGQFHSIDPRDALGMIGPFSHISVIIPSLKNFDSMNFDWRIESGKMTTDDLLIKSPDYVMDGEGTIDFDGLANFRADHFLSMPLASQLLPQMVSSFRKETKAHLGPIPILLSGTFGAAQIKPDPAQVAQLEEKIRKGKANGLLFELVME